jgi:phosphoglycerol transferase MdoB-like AlkP superfamily enzyme
MDVISMPERNLFAFNDLDNFFLIFVGAWVGAQAAQWERDFWNLILLILFMFVFVLILEGIKELIETVLHRSGKIPTALYWFCVAFLFLLLGAIDRYFENSVKTPCAVLFSMWLMFSLVASLASPKLKMTEEFSKEESQQ